MQLYLTCYQTEKLTWIHSVYQMKKKKKEKKKPVIALDKILFFNP